MIVVFADFVRDAIQQFDQLLVVGFCAWHAHCLRNRGPRLCYLFEFSSGHLFLPFACVVLVMSQHVTDIKLVPIIMDGSDESNFVATDIEDGEFSHLISLRKDLAEFNEV